MQAMQRKGKCDVLVLEKAENANKQIPFEVIEHTGQRHCIVSNDKSKLEALFFFSHPH